MIIAPHDTIQHATETEIGGTETGTVKNVMKIPLTTEDHTVNQVVETTGLQVEVVDMAPVEIMALRPVGVILDLRQVDLLRNIPVPEIGRVEILDTTVDEEV